MSTTAACLRFPLTGVPRGPGQVVESPLIRQCPDTDRLFLRSPSDPNVSGTLRQALYCIWDISEKGPQAMSETLYKELCVHTEQMLVYADGTASFNLEYTGLDRALVHLGEVLVAMVEGPFGYYDLPDATRAYHAHDDCQMELTLGTALLLPRITSLRVRLLEFENSKWTFSVCPQRTEAMLCAVRRMTDRSRFKGKVPFVVDDILARVNNDYGFKDSHLHEPITLSELMMFSRERHSALRLIDAVGQVHHDLDRPEFLKMLVDRIQTAGLGGVACVDLLDAFVDTVSVIDELRMHPGVSCLIDSEGRERFYTRFCLNNCLTVPVALEKLMSGLHSDVAALGMGTEGFLKGRGIAYLSNDGNAVVHP